MTTGGAPFETVAVFRGIHNNWLAPLALWEDTRRRGADAVWFLGDVVGFGPHPDRSVELLAGLPIRYVAGNYDHSIGSAADDC